MMKYSRLGVLTTIIIVAVLTGFILSVPRARDNGKIVLPEQATLSVPTVTIRDSFKKGVHTLTGSVVVPNACTTVTADASLVEGTEGTPSILIALVLPKDSGVCLQIPTTVSFSATLSAPSGLPITATVNGETATTTVS